MEETLRLGVEELGRRYRSRDLSAVEVIDAVATRIEQTQPTLNMFVTLCLDRARQEAGLADRRFGQGTARPLEGIPLAVKDLLDTEGVRTTYGSSMFASHLPRSDAVAVRLAREAGAIVVGKTATHEFAWGITCENPHYGACRNPWDPERISGGSSGGSAAALAVGAAPIALGSDTGGSIRIPAAFCGVVGLKPTYDRVDPTGAFPLAPSLDHVGAMARRPGDAWRLYEVIAGIDRQRHPPGATSAGTGALDGVRIGLCPDLHGAPLSDDVERVLGDATAVAEGLGAATVELDFLPTPLILPTFATVQGAEAVDTHHRHGLFPRRASEYGADVRGRLERATGIRFDDYLRAAADRARIAAAFAAMFSEVHLLLTPVSAADPVRVGETTTIHAGEEIEFRGLVMGATTPQDLAGLPACAVRGGFSASGIPVGLQLTGRLGADPRVIAAAESIFAATPDVQDRWPAI